MYKYIALCIISIYCVYRNNDISSHVFLGIRLLFYIKMWALRATLQGESDWEATAWKT